MSMMIDFVGEEEALAASRASHVILATIDKKLEDAGKLNANMKWKKKCRRVSVPLRLCLFHDQLRRKAVQCLEAQARAAKREKWREWVRDIRASGAT